MPKNQIAFVLFIVAAVLGFIAAVVPEAAGRLLPLAVTFAALGAAVQVSG